MASGLGFPNVGPTFLFRSKGTGPRRHAMRKQVRSMPGVIGVGLIPCDRVAAGDLAVEPKCVFPKLKAIAQGKKFMKL